MIRKAKQEDLEELKRMSKMFVAEAPYTVPYDEETVTEMLVGYIEAPEDECILIVSEVEGKVVGFFMGFLAPVFFNKNYMQALELAWWVDEEYRNSGEGLLLFKAFELWGNHYNVHQHGVCTMSSNKTLVNFFQSEGYTPREFYHIKEVA